jgi:hypothetical protein
VLADAYIYELGENESAGTGSSASRLGTFGSIA